MGFMVILSVFYFYLVIGENVLVLSIVIFMVWELWRKEEKRILFVGMCLVVWCFEVVYYEVICKCVFYLEEEVY